MSQTFRIGVDARPLTSPMSGVARVISSVLRNLPDTDRFHFYLYASRPCHSDFNDVLDLPNVTWVQGDGWMANRAGFWYNFRLPVLLRQNPVDLFWGSQQVIPPGLSRDVPVLLTCYDLVSTFYPDTMRPLARMQQRAVMRLSMRRADRILAISTQTRDDTVQEYDYPLEQAGVALLGYEMPEVPVGEELEQLRGEVALRLGFRPTEDFILAVSTIEPRKNYGVLLDAYMQYYRRVGLKAYPLVIAGRRGWETPEFYRRLEDYQRECGRIHTLEGLSDRHLNELYRTCGLFCMPSLYEGFGLPLLEALCNGRRALASDIPCFHEIGGDYVAYLPPNDVEAWAAALEKHTLHETVASSSKYTRKGRTVRLAGGGVAFPAQDWGWDRTAAIYHEEFLALLDPAPPAAAELTDTIENMDVPGTEESVPATDITDATDSDSGSDAADTIQPGESAESGAGFFAAAEGESPQLSLLDVPEQPENSSAEALKPAARKTRKKAVKKASKQAAKKAAKKTSKKAARKAAKKAAKKVAKKAARKPS